MVMRWPLGPFGPLAVRVALEARVDRLRATASSACYLVTIRMAVPGRGWAGAAAMKTVTPPQTDRMAPRAQTELRENPPLPAICLRTAPPRRSLQSRLPEW